MFSDFLGFNTHFRDRSLTDRTKTYRSMGVNTCLGQEPMALRSRVKRKVLFWSIHQLFFRRYNFIDIGLGDTVPGGAIIDDIEDLKALIHTAVSPRRTPDPARKNVVRFHLTERGRCFFGQLAPLINQQIPYYADKLDLRSTYFEQRKLKPVESKFLNDRIKVQIHIRLGDTALIETPWDTFVPLWSGWSLIPLKEYPDKSDKIFGQVMDVADYFRFSNSSVNTEANELSTVIFSDGFAAAFKELFRLIDDLHLDDNKISLLENMAPNYEKKAFSVFDETKDCEYVVGENNKDLQEVIHSSLLADVIIVGCHQRMIPKFLATYYDSTLKHPPIIIALYKSRLPCYEEVLGLDPTKALIYSVDITHPGTVTEALTRAIEEIKRRYT